MHVLCVAHGDILNPTASPISMDPSNIGHLNLLTGPQKVCESGTATPRQYRVSTEELVCREGIIGHRLWLNRGRSSVLALCERSKATSGMGSNASRLGLTRVTLVAVVLSS